MAEHTRTIIPSHPTGVKVLGIHICMFIYIYIGGVNLDMGV